MGEGGRGGVAERERERERVIDEGEVKRRIKGGDQEKRDTKVDA